MKPWYRGVLAGGDPVVRAQVGQALARDRQSARGAADPVGHIVEFRRGQAHCCGVVRPHPGVPDVWRIFDQEGGLRSVPAAKVVDLSDERLHVWERTAVVQALQAVDRRREQLREGLDVETLWQVAAEEPERAWTLEELAALAFGPTRSSDLRAALSRALDQGAWFVRRDQTYTPRLAAEVEAQFAQRQGEARERERLVRWGAWVRAVADGETVGRPADAAEAVSLLEQAALKGEDETSQPRVVRLLQEARLHGPLAAFEVLVRLGHWSRDENLAVRRYGLDAPFAPAAEAAAGVLRWRRSARHARRWWLGATYGLGGGAGGLDRALSVRRAWGGLRVALHLASPALLDDPAGVVAAAAQERGTSTHLPERVIPMLPPGALAACRLVPRRWRPALTVAFTVRQDGRLADPEVSVRRVRVGTVLPWDQPGELRPRQRRWCLLVDLARALRREREDRGAVILPPERLQPRAQGGVVTLLRTPPDDPLPRVVEELTVAAQALVGGLCADHGIPAVYRVSPAAARATRHGPPALWAYQQGLLLPRASLQVEPAPHGALGADRYVPLSQPLHRATDLLMHRQLVRWLYQEPLEPSERVREAVGAAAWIRERAAEAERVGRRYWLLRYLEGQGQAPLAATVLEQRGTHYLVELEETGLRVGVETGGQIDARPGDRMAVVVSQVSARRDVLRLRRSR